MATIETGSGLFTLVNVFEVDPKDQKTLCEHLVKVTEDLIKDLPGFVSANFHLSHDGTHVINYAQWRSEADFRAMHSDPRLQEHFTFCRSISKPRPIFCDVTYASKR